MLTLKNINKRYLHEHVLENINLTLPSAGFVSLVGPSGCGKSTLLHIIAGLDHDYSGTITFDKPYRISMIFQEFHLIPWLSSTNNIQLYDYFHKTSYALEESLTRDFKKIPIMSLSLGQRQRIAISRSLYYDPEIILCDEPTASLDPQNAQEVLRKLKIHSQHALVLFVSHDQSLVEEYSDRIIKMKDGCIVEDINKHLTDIKPVISNELKKHKHVPILSLTIRSFLSHRKRFFQMSFALMMALLCLMITFTFALSFRQTIYDYLISLLPQNAITYKLHNDDTLPLEMFEEAKYQYVNLEDYDLMGISANKERYLKNEVLFISDDSSFSDSYIYGRAPQNKDEIAVPLSTAKKLALDKDVQSILDKQWTIYYKHELKIKGKQVKIVGISPQNYTYDMFYMTSFANYYWIQDVFKTNPLARYGLLRYENKQNLLQKLKNKYTDYDFKTMGSSTKKTFQKNMDRIQAILILFSLLTIFSSIFMIIEIMMLHARSLKKDHAIMKAYGETNKHILKMSLYQCMILHFYSYLTSSLILMIIIKFMNNIIPGLTDFPIHIQIQPLLMFILFMASLFLVVFSSLFSFIYIIRLNPSQVLKMR